MFVTRWLSFHLVNGQCVHKKHQITRRVRCERRKPKIHVGKCDGTKRLYTIMTKKVQGCKCVLKLRRRTHRCGCPKKVRFIRGKCQDSWAIDKFLRLKFMKSSRKCHWSVIKIRRRRCACPRPIIRKLCQNHHIKVVKKIKFILQAHTNSCLRKVTAYRKKINCSPHPRLVQRRSGKCSKSTNYRQVDRKVYKVAKNCKCHTFSRRISWPCACFKIHPPQVRKICRGDYILKIKLISYNKGKHCRKKAIKKRFKIVCRGKRLHRGKCNRKTGKRKLTTYVKRVSKCKCVWRVHRVKHALCMCPRPRKFTRCVKNAWQTVTLKHRLLKDRCINEKSVVRKHIRCRLGTRVKQTRCFYFRGYKKYIKIKHWVENCKCRKAVSVRKCQCVCPKSYNYNQCDPVKGVIKHTRVSYILRKCRCITKRRVSTSVISCPEKSVVNTKCSAKGNRKHNDAHKNIITKLYPRHGCKCLKRIKKKTILCGCAPKPRKSMKCVDNKVVQIRHTRRVLKNKKCVRLIVRTVFKRIHCGKRSVSFHCNKKTGKEVVVITIPKAFNCGCKRVVRTKHRRCKCDRSLHPIKKLPCNKHCRKTKIFRFFVLRNHKCKPNYVAKTKTCCCPKRRSSRSQCHYNKGLVEIVFKSLKLVAGHCRTVTRIRRRFVHCAKNMRISKDKRPDGTLKITISKNIRVGCKCKRVHKNIYKIWNCPRGYSKTRCVDAPEPAFEHTKVVFRRTKYSTCKRVVKVKLQPIRCPQSFTTWSNCKRGKNGKYNYETTVTHFVHQCRCKKKIERRCQLCSCRKPITRKYCDLKRGAHVKLTLKFKPHGCKVCKAVKYKRSRKVQCNPVPRYYRTTKCHPSKGVKFKLFVVKKRVGCSCKKKIISQPCTCKCKPKRKLVKCVNHKLLLFKTIRYTLSKCKCYRHVGIKYRRIHCPSTKVHVGKCHSAGKCHKTITIVQHKYHNCKCLKKIMKKRKRCCCPGPWKQKLCKHGVVQSVKGKYFLHKDRCLLKLRKRSHKISCTEKNVMRVSGPCIHNIKDIKYGSQRYTIIKSVRQGCKCMKVKRHIYRKCLCPLKKAAEVIFLIDESVHSRQPFFRKRVSKFLRRATAYFPIGRHSIRVALVKYSQHPSVILNLNHKHDHSHIYAAIKHVPYSGSRSNLDQALRLVKKKLLPRARKLVPIHLFIITDGVSKLHYKETLRETVHLKQKGVHINIVAVGPKIRNEDKLQSLVTRGSYQYLGDMKYIKHLPEIVAGRLCGKVCPPSSVKIKKCSKSTGCKGRTYFSKFVFSHKEKKCVRKMFVETRRCCCPFPGKKWTQCIKNKKYKFRTYWKFFSGKCHKDLLQKDISGPIYAKCRPKMRVHVGKCREDNYKAVTFIKRKIINCKCRTFKSVKQQLCRCPKPIKRKFCHKKMYIVKERISFHLRKNKCVKSKSRHRSMVVCPNPMHSTSPCNKITCKRRISYAIFKPSRCKCRKHLKYHFVRCCCKPNTIRQKQCMKHKYIRYSKHWIVFDPERKVCVRKSNEKMRKINCRSKRRIVSSRCGVRHRGKMMLRTIEVTWKVYRHCQCVKKRRMMLKPCGCTGGHKFKICKHGHIVGIKVDHILDKNKCKKRRRIYSKQRIVCSISRRIRRSKCSIVRKEGKKGHVYRKVTIFSKVRVGCKCRVKRSTRLQLCRCPKSHKIIRCHRHKRVKYIVSYQLHKKYCKKHLAKKVQVLACPKPQIIKSKCHKKKMRIQVKLWKMTNCHCKSHRIFRVVSCKMGRSSGRRIILNYDKCMDLLPPTKCRELAAYPHNICRKKGKFRDYFCRKTCRRCQNCKSSEIDFRIHYRSCLVSDKRYKKRFLVRFFRNKPYFYCKLKCRDNPNCLSFDYYLPQGNYHKGITKADYKKGKRYGNCVLNTVDPKTLIAELYPQKGKIGASVGDLVRHGAKKCILSRKICVKKCRPAKVRASRKCHCLKTKRSHTPHCFRLARIFYYRRSKSSGKCIKRRWKGIIPCKKRVCDDFRSKHYCQRMKKAGKCFIKKVAQSCKRSCSQCRCDKNFEYRTKCNKKGIRRHIKISYRRHPRHKKCVIKLKHFSRQCQYCPEGKFQVVHPCKKERRMVTTVVSHLKQNGKCSVRTQRHVYSCHKCPTDDKVVVGHCRDGILRVTTYYTIRIKSCCQQKTNVRLFKCFKCPTKKVLRTKCSHGSRLRHIVYYVRFKNGTKRCAKRIHTRMEKCKSWKYCRDEMNKSDCMNFRKYGSCRKQKLDAKRLCAKTCGFC